MKKIHELVHKLHNPDLGVLFVRLAVGIVFVHAGYLKIMNMDMVLAGFSSMGFASALAYFVSYAELICGVLMLVGIFVRYAGIVLAIIMLVAMFKAHWANGFGLQNQGYEYVLVLLLLSASIVTTGAGKYSLAKVLKK